MLHWVADNDGVRDGSRVLSESSLAEEMHEQNNAHRGMMHNLL